MCSMDAFRSGRIEKEAARKREFVGRYPGEVFVSGHVVFLQSSKVESPVVISKSLGTRSDMAKRELAAAKAEIRAKVRSKYFTHSI